MFNVGNSGGSCQVKSKLLHEPGGAAKPPPLPLHDRCWGWSKTSLVRGCPGHHSTKA